MTIREVSLNQLVLSPLNMRQGDVDVSDLIASIGETGTLLQNLRVTEEQDAKGKATGKFEVHVGGRRLRALQALAKAKKIAKDFAVPVVVCADAMTAMEESVAENMMRLDPHPADQYVAFSKLIEAGRTPAEVAARFGISERIVNQRMAIAKLHPELLEKYRAGELAADAVRAYCLFDDQARQIEVYESLGYYKDSANSIRGVFNQSVTYSTSGIASFVGREAYLAAGGTVRADLFSDAEYFEDSELLAKLASEKLEEAKAQIEAEGWSWVEVLDGYPDYRMTGSMERLYRPRVRLTDEQEARMGEIEAMLESYGSEALDERGQAEVQALEEEVAAMTATVWPQWAKELGGAFVYLNGSTLTVDFYAKKEQAKLVKALQNAPEGTTVEAVTAAIAEAPAVESGMYSDALLADLTAHRTAAIRSAMLSNAKVAQVALLHRMLQTGYYSQSAVQMKSDWPKIERHSTTLDTNKGFADFEAAWFVLTSDLPKDAAELWDYLMKQDDLWLMQMQTAVIAANIDTTIQPKCDPTGPNQNAQMLASALGVDMRDYWTVSADFLNRMKAPGILEVAKEATGAELAGVSGLKKRDLANKAAEAMQGSNWLPPVLRLAAAVEADSAEDVAEAA